MRDIGEYGDRFQLFPETSFRVEFDFNLAFFPGRDRLRAELGGRASATALYPFDDEILVSRVFEPEGMGHDFALRHIAKIERFLVELDFGYDGRVHRFLNGTFVPGVLFVLVLAGPQNKRQETYVYTNFPHEFHIRPRKYDIISKNQVLYGIIFIPDVFHRFDAYLEVLVREFLGDHPVRLRRLDSLGNHRAVGDQQQGPRGNTVGESDRENGGGFHVYGEGPRLQQVFLEMLVELPDAPVRGINYPRVVHASVVRDGFRAGFLERERGERGYLAGKIVVGGPFPLDGGDGKHVVTDLVLGLQAAAFT